MATMDSNSRVTWCQLSVVVLFSNVGKLIVVNVGVHPSQLKSFCKDMNIWYQVSPCYVFYFSNYSPHMRV